jgi:hypothetical protein
MIFSALTEKKVNHAGVLDSLKDKFSYSRQYNKYSTKLHLIHQILIDIIKENELSDKFSTKITKDFVGLTINYNYLNMLQNKEEKYKHFMGLLNSIIYNFDHNKIELYASLKNSKLNINEIKISNEKSKELFLDKVKSLYQDIRKNSVNDSLSLNLEVKAIEYDDNGQINESYYPNVQINIYENDGQ